MDRGAWWGTVHGVAKSWIFQETEYENTHSLLMSNSLSFDHYIAVVMIFVLISQK